MMMLVENKECVADPGTGWCITSAFDLSSRTGKQSDGSWSTQERSDSPSLWLILGSR
jgi:hypothetical protein